MFILSEQEIVNLNYISWRYWCVVQRGAYAMLSNVIVNLNVFSVLFVSLMMTRYESKRIGNVM